MLDNNLSHCYRQDSEYQEYAFQSFLCWIIIYHLCRSGFSDNPFSGFQSFLCWIIIYHPNTVLGVSVSFFVSILLMLDNNLSPVVGTELDRATGFQSFLCWIIIYHPWTKKSSSGRKTMFQSFLCWIIIYHLLSYFCPLCLVTCFNPSYAG